MLLESRPLKWLLLKNGKINKAEISIEAGRIERVTVWEAARVVVSTTYFALQLNRVMEFIVA